MLEVKSGTIARDARKGVWTTTTKHGNTNRLDEPPPKQAGNNRYALERLLGRQIARFEKHPPASGGVCAVPDRSARGDLASYLPRECILYRKDLFDIDLAVDKLLDTALAGGQPLGPPGVEQLVALLAPSFTLTLALGEALSDVEDRIVEFTAEQPQLLDFLAHQRRTAIHGGAGTGKTVLAREKAARLARQGERTLPTCFNRPLAEHLQQSCAGIEGLTVHELMEQTVGAERVADGKPASGSDGVFRTWFEETLPGLFIEALDAVDGQFEAIVVDEAQDFREDCLELLHCLAHPSEDVLYALLDPRRGIYHKQDRPFLASLPTYPLRRNLRNSKPIHELAQQFRRRDDVEAAVDEGPEVATHLVHEGGSLRREFSRVLHRLIREGGPEPERVAILTPRRIDKVFLGTAAPPWHVRREPESSRRSRQCHLEHGTPVQGAGTDGGGAGGPP